MSHDVTVGWGKRVRRSLRNSQSSDDVDSMSCVLTSLLAMEMLSMLFPASSHPAITLIPPPWIASSRLKIGFPGRGELWMVFAWTSTLDSAFPDVGLL